MTRMLFVGLMAALFTLPAAAQPPAKAQVSAAVRSLAFSDDGSRLAAGVMPPGRGGAVIVWDVATRKPVSKYEQAGESPNVAFTPDGKTLVFANGRSSLVLLDPATGAKTGESGPLPAQVTSLHRGPDGMWLALGTDNTVYLWDPAARKVVRSFAFGKQPWSWAASPKGGWLFVSGNGRDKLWNEKTRVAALLQECDSDDYPTREKAATALAEVGAAAEPLLRQAMSDGPSAEVRMRARVAREAILNKPKFRLTGHAEDIRPIAFSP